MVIQVNGKLRGTITISEDLSKEDIIKLAKNIENVEKFMESAETKKIIYIEKKLINFVVN